MAGMAAGMKGRGQLRRDKAALTSDLQLASEELDRAASLDPGVILETDQGTFGIPRLRAAIPFYLGFASGCMHSSVLQPPADVERPSN
jgi:hypothetical protein